MLHLTLSRLKNLAKMQLSTAGNRKFQNKSSGACFVFIEGSRKPESSSFTVKAHGVKRVATAVNLRELDEIDKS